MTTERLDAADGLTLHLHSATPWRMAWGEPDWLGPVGFAVEEPGAGRRAPGARCDAMAPAAWQRSSGSDALGQFTALTIEWSNCPLPLRTSVRAYSALPVIVFRLEATAPLSDLSGGRFEQPVATWPWLQPAQRRADGAPAALRSYGHQYSEFALPVSGDANCTGFLFAPHRPPVVEPLLFIAPDGRTLLLAPLDQFHDQIISVPADTSAVDAGVRCGWHGDLATVAAGFATELAVWAADGPRAALTAWADELRRRHPTQRLSRYADDLVGKLSYWTDNGAVYYYRTEPGCDYTTTLERVVADLHEREVPVQSVQIDSWFYPHQNLREVSPDGAPLVPPSGMMRWEPRADLFPDGFHDLRKRVGGLPLTFHSRHFSAQSPYFEHYAAWRDGEYAHPSGPELPRQLMAQAASWGAITYEQDWMVESFLGVRGLRAAPGRARAWQEDLDSAAAEHGMHLQWCMSTPADFMQSVTLRTLASIRTSGDYRYLFDNGLNWVWFLHTNALARALGLTPFKDVFLSHGPSSLSDGEAYAEIEALLASLSTGPVGIGDQLGCTNRDLVMRTCREDGVLIKPDVPLAAVDRCFGANAFLEPVPLIGECYSAHPAGRWIYVASFNACRHKQPLSCRVELADLGSVRPDGPIVAYDWRRGTCSRLAPDDGWDMTLAFQDWDYRILCPLLPGDITVFGDVTKYASAGDRRIRCVASAAGVLGFDVLGAPRSFVEVHGYAAVRPAAVTVAFPAAPRHLACGSMVAGSEGWAWNAASSVWRLVVHVGPLGFVHVTVSTDRPA